MRIGDVKPALKRYVPAAQIFAARVVLFHQALAKRVGLNPTEFKCFRLAGLADAMTISELARETGLTLPAITVIVDRLTELGFVTREKDEADRRKVMVRVTERARRRVDALYDDYSARIGDVLNGYSKEQFDLILDYMNRVSGLMQDEIQRTDDR